MIKYISPILIFLSIFCIAQAQVFDNVYPTSVPALSSNKYTPFSNPDRPILRGIDPDDTGDPIGGTGGDDGNGNQNDIPIGDGVSMIILVALAYMVKSIRKVRKMKNKE